MNFTGFSKFLKDANLIKQTQTNKKRTVDLSISVRSMSNSKFKNNNLTRSQSNLNILKKSPSTFSNVYDGKLSETEISIIFSQICAVNTSNTNSDKYATANISKNDKSNTFKSNLQSFNKISKNTHKFEKSNCISIQNKPSSNKMNFPLFLKSFEVIALKLHPSDTLDDALIYFFDIDIVNIIKERAENTTSKQNILEVLKYLKRDEIVWIIYKI